MHWELCLKDKLDAGYPEVIARIGKGDPGKSDNVSNLGWIIYEPFKNQGIMSKFLELYLSEVQPNGLGFAVVILNDNIASYKLALKNGFKAYDEDKEKIYLFRKH